MMFKNREDAAHQLVNKIFISDPKNTVVLALPRGGVPLGIIIAEAFSVVFDVILAKKIGHPHHSEYAIGAVAEDGEPLQSDEMRYLDSEWIDQKLGSIHKEMERRRSLYDQVLKKQSLKDKDVIIVDDGIATGLTMFAAIESVKQQNPKTISIAVPVIPEDTYTELMKQIDEVFFIEVPRYFRGGVGAYYYDFAQISDGEVQELLTAYRESK